MLLFLSTVDPPSLWWCRPRCLRLTQPLSMAVQRTRAVPITVELLKSPAPTPRSPRCVSKRLKNTASNSADGNDGKGSVSQVFGMWLAQ